MAPPTDPEPALGHPAADSTSTTCCGPRRSRRPSPSSLTDRRTPRTTARSTPLLDPAVERFQALDEEDRLGFKDALDKFVRTYSFLSQVVSFGDSKLERDYLYCRALASVIRQSWSGWTSVGGRTDPPPQRDHLRGSLSLDAETGEVKSVFGEARRSAGRGYGHTLSRRRRSGSPQWRGFATSALISG